jgi:hypothetical protein
MSLENQAEYDADEDIYGSFLELQKRIQALYDQQGGDSYSDQLNDFLAR